MVEQPENHSNPDLGVQETAPCTPETHQRHEGICQVAVTIIRSHTSSRLYARSESFSASTMQQDRVCGEWTEGGGSHTCPLCRGLSCVYLRTTCGAQLDHSLFTNKKLVTLFYRIIKPFPGNSENGLVCKQYLGLSMKDNDGRSMAQ